MTFECTWNKLKLGSCFSIIRCFLFRKPRASSYGWQWHNRSAIEACAVDFTLSIRRKCCSTHGPGDSVGKAKKKRGSKSPTVQALFWWLCTLARSRRSPKVAYLGWTGAFLTWKRTRSSLWSRSRPRDIDSFHLGTKFAFNLFFIQFDTVKEKSAFEFHRKGLAHCAKKGLSVLNEKFRIS